MKYNFCIFYFYHIYIFYIWYYTFMNTIKICYPSSILYNLTNLIVENIKFLWKIINLHKIEMYFNFSFLPSSLFLNLQKKKQIPINPESKSLVVPLYADRRLNWRNYMSQKIWAHVDKNETFARPLTGRRSARSNVYARRVLIKVRKEKVQVRYA